MTQFIGGKRRFFDDLRGAVYIYSFSPVATMNYVDLPALEDFPDHWFPFADALKQTFPLGLTPISAGFPSPAEDYADRSLDINDYLVRNPVSTFFFQVQGDSMQGAEIFDGDILVVDRSLTPQHGHIVVAFLNGERLVKRFFRRGGRVALIAENPAYPALDLHDGVELIIWGVVVGKFKRIGS